MRTYSKSLLNNSITLELRPYTLGGRIETQSNLEAIKDTLPENVGELGGIDWQIHANAEICCLFWVLCAGVTANNDVIDVVMLADYFNDNKDKPMPARWESWKHEVTSPVQTALLNNLNVIDERLQAPTPLQAVPKKKTKNARSS